MTTMTPAFITPAVEMAGGLNPKCSDTGRGAFGRNGGHAALWRPLLILAMLLLPAFLLSACADIRIGGFSFGSCLINGEEFKHVSNAVIEIRTDSVPQRVLETHTKMELKVHRSPQPDHVRGMWGFGERGVYLCVVKKSDWPEAMPAKLSFFQSRDKITAITPRSQTVLFHPHDIDHWALRWALWE